MAYGSTPDAFDEYLQMSEHTARDALFFFNMCIIELYMPKYLRKPTSEDVVKIQQKHNNVHGFPGMLGSTDSSQDLWIWHAFYGMAGANNDINVLDNSPLFDDLLDDLAPVVPYVVNGVEYRNGYYLADGIYPEWASFVKSFTVATDPKHTYFKQRQESARKDVERGGAKFDASQYAFFGNQVLEEVELGGLDDDEEEDIAVAKFEEEEEFLLEPEEGVFPGIDDISATFSKVISVSFGTWINFSSTKMSWGQALELLVNEVPEKVSTHLLVDLDILVSGFDMISLMDSQTWLLNCSVSVASALASSAAGWAHGGEYTNWPGQDVIDAESLQQSNRWSNSSLPLQDASMLLNRTSSYQDKHQQYLNQQLQDESKQYLHRTSSHPEQYQQQNINQHLIDESKNLHRTSSYPEQHHQQQQHLG
ncbi:PAT1 homolog 1-like protein, partial [Tanacetum coccineum]